MERRQGRFFAAVCVSAAFALGGAAFAQSTGISIEEFHASLDPRVFQPGGYGPWPEPLGPIFTEAAARYNVPRELLLTLAWLGSGFENRGDQPTIELGYGVMALRDNPWGGDSLPRAAALLQTPADSLKANPRWNITAAAAVLDAYAREAQIDRAGGPNEWLGPVSRYAGLDDEHSRIFATEVMGCLKTGLDVTNHWGETFSFNPLPITLDVERLAMSAEMQVLSPDYPPAVWDPAPSCNYSSATSNKDTIVIHTVEGSYAGCISWMKNCNSNVSAQYVIAYDGRITQMVRENQTAWHVGCYNSRAIGYEHEGYAAQSHPTSQYNASALLSRDICNRWGIPKAKRSTGPGILGHHDVTICCCGTHTDPDPGWDWNYYIQQVNGTPPPPAWAATYNAQSYPATMTAGATAVVWAEFRNDGTSSWTHCATKLGTSGPRDRTSPFCTPANWRCADGSNPGCNRPTDVDQSSVAQGSIGRFTFILTAPSTPGTYTERFQLVQEGVTWFGPEITWTITVTAAQGNLTGTVRNAGTGAAISGAAVTLGGVGNATTNTSGVYTFNNVNAGTYTVSVSAAGFNAASGSATITAGQTTTRDFSLTPADTQAPTVPANLTATATSATSVQLTWTASTDNVAVAGYDIRRGSTIIGSSTGTAWTDTGATPASTLTYSVRARDAVPNYSDWSQPATATTPPAPPQLTVVFTDGFDGNLNNWTQQTQNYDYSTAVNHGTYAGAGAAFMGAGQSDQMYRAFARPFAQGRGWGWFYDGKGGWKAGVCGWSYRQAFSLRDPDNAARMYIDNEFYNAPDNSKYYYRLVAGGGGTHTPYATRDPNTDCAGAWVCFETTVTPAAVGAGPPGSIQLKVTDRAGSTTTTINMPADYFDWGIGRVTLGLGITSTNEGYWDDIGFEAWPPDWPLMGTPEALSASEIRWNFSPRDNNFFGWDIADGGGVIVAPQYPAAGWLGRNATAWTEGGLTPNTAYTRKVRAWNGTLNGAWSLTATAYTLSVPPDEGSVTPNTGAVCAGDNIVWTAAGGFGPGKVQHYRYAWNQNATHAFTGAEPIWAAGTLVTQAAAPGTWYLHVQGVNAAGAANGTHSYPLTVRAGTAIVQHPAGQNACAGGTVVLNVSAVGGAPAYQWQRDGVNLNDGGGITGAATASLRIADFGPDDVGRYRCVVTGDCGSAVSNEAAVTLRAATAITQQPQWQDVCAGFPASFSVSAVGEGTLAYQWQKNGVDIPGATAATYTVPQAHIADRADYRCVVTGACGTAVSNEANLSVKVLIADFNEDCDVDLADFTAFQACFNGPNRPPAAGCPTTVTDMDEDGDVDLSDFAIFQDCFDGPNTPPGTLCPNR